MTLMLSATNTWLLYSLMTPSLRELVLRFGKYRIPFRLKDTRDQVDQKRGSS